MNKKDLTEADIRTKFITPALDKDKQGAWDLMTQLLEEHYFTKGRVIVRGQTVHRGEAKKADYRGGPHHLDRERLQLSEIF